MGIINISDIDRMKEKTWGYSLLSIWCMSVRVIGIATKHAVKIKCKIKIPIK